MSPSNVCERKSKVLLTKKHVFYFHRARRRQNQNADASRRGPPSDEEPPESPEKPSQQLALGEEEETKPTVHHNTADDESSATWESNTSDALNSSVGGSSVWTDSSNPADRSSRRALILQMAKARMKSNKDRDPAEHDAIVEEQSNEVEDDPVDQDMDQHSAPLSPRNFDLAADLD